MYLAAACNAKLHQHHPCAPTEENSGSVAHPTFETSLVATLDLYIV